MTSLPRQLLLAAGLLGAALLVSALLVYSRPPPPSEAIATAPLLIDVAEAVYQETRIDIRSQGTVEPTRRSHLTSEVSGAIVWVAPELAAGEFVPADKLLLRIDNRNYLAEVKRAEASVAAARSTLAQEQGRGVVARQEWLSNPKRERMSQSSRSLALREPQLAEADAHLAAMEAQLERARNDLTRTEIRSPFAGLVKEKQVELGQFVATGSAIAEIYGTDSAEIRLPVPEDQLSYLDTEALRTPDAGEVPVHLSNTSGGIPATWNARLIRTEGMLDPRSHVLFTIARIEDPYGLHSPRAQILRFGSFVTADIVGRKFSKLIAVPRHLLRSGNQLWIVDEDGKLQAREVELLRNRGELAWVRSGLLPGEKIAITALPTSMNGRKVSINRQTTSQEVAQRYLNTADQAMDKQLQEPADPPRTAQLTPR